MRTQLSDMVHQVAPLFEKVKVTGTADSTKIEACDKDKILFLVATMKQPIPEFQGEFGLGSLSVLNGLLNLPQYKSDDAKFLVHRSNRQNDDYVAEFEFQDHLGGNVRFKTMNARLVGEQATIATIPWTVQVTPTKAKVTEMAQLSGLLSEVDKSFGVKLEGGTLFLTIGGEQAGAHTASVAFATEVEGDFAAPRLVFNTAHFLSILKSAANNPATARFSARGVAGISVETDAGVYNYYLRGREG